MDTEKLANLLLSNVTKDVDFWRGKYPARDLPNGAHVTRLPPSPTGFLHLGALYMGLINQRIARDSKGIFILRIEDTDGEREIPGARGLIVKGLNQFGILPDEGLKDSVGMVADDIKNEKGNYGPYIQSARQDIYQSFVKDLIKRGLAYPCFMTKEELDVQRKEQESLKVRPGYYGKFAKWRDATMESIQERMQKNETFTIRLKSTGDQNTKQSYKDEFLGDLQIPENDEDFPLLKSNGMPTYHLAHVVDDYLMGTTFVIRGEEWLSSVPKHINLWKAFNLAIPLYGHVMPINKQDGSSVRKLSKRKDPEANIEMYTKAGYPETSVIGYLYRLANPSFDDWWQSDAVRKSKNISVWDFPFSIEGLKRGGRGPLVDTKKLDDISSDVIARMSADEVSKKMIEWAEINDSDFAKTAEAEMDYFIKILSIERDESNPRKDITSWGQGKVSFDYFFDKYFSVSAAREILLKDLIDENRMNTVVKDLAHALAEDMYYTEMSLEKWLDSIKKLADILGFASDRKLFKEKPDAYKGDFAMFMKVIRVAITGRDRTPNLFYVLKVMGKDRVLSRLGQI